MSTEPTPWEVIRAAADRLEWLAQGAVTPPWAESGGSVRAGKDEEWDVANCATSRTAAWIATLSPAVAEPLVAWLRDAGDAWEIIGVAMWPPATVSYKAALDFARLILGSADHG
jgi:hypothetical protein